MAVEYGRSAFAERTDLRSADPELARRRQSPLRRVPTAYVRHCAREAYKRNPRDVPLAVKKAGERTAGALLGLSFLGGGLAARLRRASRPGHASSNTPSRGRSAGP
ncbi:hypothetical protein ADL22_16515 [Streptomyces sp. NRRL F-4489]|nr:hypothetical protein ADL22_16515 [Streptomyces sp. NRRL F-4489]